MHSMADQTRSHFPRTCYINNISIRFPHQKSISNMQIHSKYSHCPKMCCAVYSASHQPSDTQPTANSGHWHQIDIQELLNDLSAHQKLSLNGRRSPSTYQIHPHPIDGMIHANGTKRLILRIFAFRCERNGPENRALRWQTEPTEISAAHKQTTFLSK